MAEDRLGDATGFGGPGEAPGDDELVTHRGIDEVAATCPWCFEPMQLDIDWSGGSHQRYVEDCWVCCRPSVITVRFDAEGDVTVEVERE